MPDSTRIYMPRTDYRLHQRRIWRKHFFTLLSLGYAALLIMVCVTRFKFISPYLGLSITHQGSVNLVPFHNILRGIDASGAFSWDTVGNIIMFIPVGVVVRYYQKWGWSILAVMMCSMLSAGIEISQYYLQTGSSDIDDIITNTLGGLLGVLLFSIAKWTCRRTGRDVHDVVAQYATIFPPFLLYFVANMFFRENPYQFRPWHAAPVAVYFILCYLIFLRDLRPAQKLVHAGAAGLFFVYFFFSFL